MFGNILDSAVCPVSKKNSVVYDTVRIRHGALDDIDDIQFSVTRARTVSFSELTVKTLLYRITVKSTIYIWTGLTSKNPKSIIQYYLYAIQSTIKID